MFEKLEKAGLKAKPAKCKFLQEEITYLGHRISKKGIAVDPAKTEAVKSWPRPTNVSEVRAFLGFAGYYRRYVENFSKIAKPLTDQLKGIPKDIDSRSKRLKYPVEWSEELEEAFETIKQKLISPPILGFADYSLHFNYTPTRQPAGSELCCISCRTVNQR